MMEYRYGRFVPGAFTSLAGVERLLYVEDTLHFEHSRAFDTKSLAPREGGDCLYIANLEFSCLMRGRLDP